MTVCIAAVCGHSLKEGPFVVTAADRMITIGDMEYEPAQTKTVNLASQTVGLLAGDMQLHAAIVPRVQERINKHADENNGVVNVAIIADFYAEEFGYYRRQLAEREILVPRGLNFDRFLSRQATMSQHQVTEIDNRLAAYSIDSSAIIAGIDATGGHIWVIENPGVASCYDTPFFACIGSGASLAATQFMVKKFEKNWDLPRTLWLAFEAKARAQSAGGVGIQSDVVVIGRGGKKIPLRDTEKDLLAEMYARVTEKEAELAAEAGAAIEEYLRRDSQPEKQPADMAQSAATETAEESAAAAEKKPAKPAKKKKA